MTTELKQQLDAVVGKEFLYCSRIVEITKWKKVGGTTIVIWIDDRPNNFYHSEAEEFLRALQPKPEGVQTSKNKVQVSDHSENLPVPKENQTIKETLLETLQKVKEDKAFIQQAKAVCEVVNQMVNVQKTEIQIIKALKKQNR